MSWGRVELEPEVRDWLEALPTAQFATVAFYVDLLAEQGPLLGEPYTKQLSGKLRELRFHLDGRAWRDQLLDHRRSADHPAHGVPQVAFAGDSPGGPGTAGVAGVRGQGSHGR